jgi:two-component system OmpR family sensor kinase
VNLHRRLVAVMAILLVVGLGVADFVTYASVRSFLYGRADAELSSSELVAADYLSDAAARGVPVTAAYLSHRVSPDLYLLVVDAKGRTILSRPSGSPDRPDPKPTLLSTIPVEGPVPLTNPHFGRHAGTYRPDPAAVVVGGQGDPDGRYRAVAEAVPQGTLIAALSLNPTNDTLASLRRIELLASLAVVVSMGALALWLVRRGLRPLAEMAQTADAIASGDLARRVPEGSTDTEVGRLGVALNQMLTQIEGAFDVKSASEERLRQFVADASHELRTPLTSIRGYAELLRRGGFSDEAGRRRALLRIEDEATRMGGLVEDLLLLAELDRGRPLRAEPVDLGRLCADVVDDTNALDHDHLFSLDLEAPVMVLGDPERLTQVAHNLVRNALAHTPAGTTVTVSVGVEGKAADAMGFLRVTDTGPGINPLQAARIFDRFYRADPARAGAGTGLGLAIVRAIAEALHGSARLETSPAGGVSFVVALPLSRTTAPTASTASTASTPDQLVRLPQAH